MFTLKEEDIAKLCELNHFPIPDDEMIFFGFRGLLPIPEDTHRFRKEYTVEVVEPDYIHPRCTLGQWKPGEGIALFPGSTVPHQKNVKKALAKNGAGANQLMTGMYKDYRKGKHKAGSPTGHDAFRQNNKLPIRRSADDLDYDVDDRVEYMRPFDNLHAGWTMGVDSTTFASAGCQVVVGYPKCERRGNEPDIGPWKIFKKNAYDLSQKSFYYLLLPGRYVQQASLLGSLEMLQRLRFGSQGDLVSQVQTALKKRGYYEGDIDGDFGPRTLFAIIEYQTVEFGPDSADGIVGPIVTGSLGMN